jgi:membrane protease YdiL (CAAX protease family)
LFGWFLGSPLAFLIEQTIDFGLYLKWRELNYEQAAVHQLKMALSHPPMLASILFSVIVFAPITEEFLFRYVAQNYFEKILETSLCYLNYRALFCSFTPFAFSRRWKYISHSLSLDFRGIFRLGL